MIFRITSIVLLSCLLLFSCRKNKDLEPYSDLRKLYKSIKGEWDLVSRHSFTYSNSGGDSNSVSIDIENGIYTRIKKDVVTSQPNSYTTVDTTTNYYGFEINFYKYTIDHFVKYEFTETTWSGSSAPQKVTEKKLQNWRYAEKAAVVLRLLGNDLLVSVADGQLILQNESSGASPGGTWGSTDQWTFRKK